MPKFFINESVRYSVKCSAPGCGVTTGNSVHPDAVESSAMKSGMIAIFAAGEPVANFCPACIPKTIAEIIQGDAPEPEAAPEAAPETAGELFEKSE